MSSYRDRTKPWYGTARWKRIRLHQLMSEPLCCYCADEGQITAATVCDHITPHKGDPLAFWAGPFQSLCKPCHDRHKQSEEKGGKPKSIIGADGWPIDPVGRG